MRTSTLVMLVNILILSPLHADVSYKLKQLNGWAIVDVKTMESHQESRAGAYFDFECFLLKNGALYFITQQKKSFFSEIFNVVRLMDEKQTKYAPALTKNQGSQTKLGSMFAIEIPTYYLQVEL